MSRIVVSDTGQTLNFLTLSGQVDQLGTRLEKLPEREGVDGVAFRQMSKRATPFRMLATVDIDDAVDAVEEQMKVYKSLQGKSVTVKDDVDNVYTNVLVLHARLLGASRITTAVGGLAVAPTWLLRVMFLMHATEVP